jgi:hypothetical protein
LLLKYTLQIIRRIILFTLPATLLFCNKGDDDQLPIDPVLQSRLPGTYVQRDTTGGSVFIWGHTDASGSRMGADRSAKFNVTYLGGNKVKIDVVAAVPYPPIKSFTVTLKDTTYNGMKYYKFAHYIDSSSSHISIIVGGFLYYDFLLPNSAMTTLDFTYRDNYYVNNMAVAPMISVTGGDLIRKL